MEMEGLENGAKSDLQREEMAEEEDDNEKKRKEFGNL